MSLKQKAITGVFWTSVQNWGSNLLSLVVVAVLARMLQPDDFGLVALALVFIAFAQILQQLGFVPAIVQRETVEPGHLDTAFWLNAAGGFALGGIGFATAPLVARLLDVPDLADVIRWLSPMFAIGGLTTTQQAILQRTFAFRALALRRLLSTVAGGAVGIVMAVSGYGVMSLVGQSLATSLAALIALWSASDWRPGFALSWRHFRDLAGFGLHVMGMDVLSFFNRRSDDLLIGSFLGATALGFYTVGYRLLLVMTELFTQSLSSVALPTFSRLQSRPEQMRHAHGTAVATTSLLAFPAFTGIALLAPEIVTGVFGPQWTPSIPVMRILAAIGLLHAVAYYNGPIFIAMGRPAWALRLSILNTVINVTGFVFVIWMGWGIIGVAAAYVIRGYALQPIPLLLLRRLIGLDLRAHFGRLAAPLFASGVMAAAVIGARAAIAGRVGLHAGLLIEVAAGVLVYAVVIRLAAPALWHNSIDLIRMAIPGQARDDAS